MDIDLARREDLPALARLIWSHASPAEQATQSAEEFASDLRQWWSVREESHVAFVARAPDGELVGMAWLALVPRVPRPGATDRQSGDVQSVHVLPQERGRGVGARLITAATTFAFERGVGRVVVQSGRAAVPLYERLGFSTSRELLQRDADRSA